MADRMLDGVRNTKSKDVARTVAKAVRAWNELYLAAGGAAWQPNPAEVRRLSRETLRGIARMRAMLKEMEEDAHTLATRATLLEQQPSPQEPTA